MVKPSGAGTPAQAGGTTQRTYGAMRKIITKDGKIIGKATPADGEQMRRVVRGVSWKLGDDGSAVLETMPHLGVLSVKCTTVSAR